MQNHDIHVLNGLIGSTVDSADDYAEAASEAQSRRFAGIFRERASERRQIAAQLQRQVRMLGGESPDGGTALAAAHRALVRLRHNLAHGTDKDVIDAVERGESYLKSKFEHALEDNGITPETQAVIGMAYGSVKSGCEQMRNFKYAMEPAPR